MATQGTQQLAEALLAAGKAAAKGADVFARVDAGRSAHTRFARSEVTTAGDVDDVSLSLSVSFGARSASVSGNQTSKAALAALADQAARLARIAPEDPENMPSLGAQTYTAAPAAYDNATAKQPASARVDVARAAIAHGDAAGVELAGFLSVGEALTALATSAGLRASHRATYAELTTTARTKDGTGSGWAGGYSRKASGLDGGAIGKIAVEKAVRAQKPRKLAPGRYTVILEPAAVADLVTALIGDARSADEGRSFYSKKGGGTRLGETLFPKTVTLRSDPRDPLLPGTPFDGEGLPLAPITWIDQGVAKALQVDRYWAQKTKQKPTGSHDTFTLVGGTDTLDGLIGSTKRGLLVTRFWYVNEVDPQSLLMTGLTRDGVFLIEDGKIVHPVQNFRFNESPVNMLKHVDGMTPAVIAPGSSGSVACPALRAHEFLMASASDAV